MFRPMFRVDTKITDFMKAHAFTLSAEVIPPRNGMEQAQILTQIKSLINAGAQFLSVTKGAGGSLRGGSLPIAQAIKEQFGVPCIAHFTCRDLSVHDVENQLMDHHYFGIRNILALRGDPPDGQAQWVARKDGHQYAYQLMSQIRNLNQGIYLPREGFSQTSTERTDFCIGAAVYPEHPNAGERIEFFKIKIGNGAEYGITDMIYDGETYGDFLEECAKAQIFVPVLPGTRILKSKPQADRMMKKFRVKVPSKTYARLPDQDPKTDTEKAESDKIGLEELEKLISDFKRAGAPGIHLYVIADTRGASKALSHLKESL